MTDQPQVKPRIDLNPRNLFTDSSPVSGLRSIVATLAALSVLLAGCVSTKYKMARVNTPPPVPLNLVTVQLPVDVALNTVIICQGPGSWKREALWDEYIVTITNQGAQPLNIASAALTDSTGTNHAPGADMRTLEKESLILEKKYRDAGVAFIRNSAPVAVTWGHGDPFVGMGAGFSWAGVALIAAGEVLEVLAPYVRKTESLDQDDIAAEFKQRRLALPLPLAPGETRTGSLFFPMVPNPRALSLHWSNGASSGDLALALDSVHGLHVKEPAQAATAPRP
jgi:hypothetical protein